MCREKWWTWTVRIRTVAKINFQVILLDTVEVPVYQKISRKSLHLKELGMSCRKIAQQLGVDEKTVAKSIRWTKES